MTVGESWHEETVRHPVLEGAIMCCTLIAAFLVFTVVGMLSCEKLVSPIWHGHEKPSFAEAVDVPHAFADEPDAIRESIPAETEPIEMETVVENQPEYFPVEDFPETFHPQEQDMEDRYGNSFMQEGVIVSDDGREFTWYSQNQLSGEYLHELNASGRQVDEETGYVTDGEGYIAVASPDPDIPVGSEVETPWGMARVYDYNDGDSWDVYTDF